LLSKQEQLSIRQCFPFFTRQSPENPVIYLDNAATTQKPAEVIQCINELWVNGCANVHRSSHSLANKLTRQFEDARKICCDFIGAANSDEIIWTTGTTESINLVATSWGDNHVNEGDEVLVTEMEHHANLLPWQQLCNRRRATLRIVPITDKAEIDMQQLEALLSPRVKLLAITHVSNVLGTINPIKHIVKRCHQHNIKVLVDGAQAIAHQEVDVQDLDCDFYAFSGHKCFAPEATGVLYGKYPLLQAMEPWKTGGEMVKNIDDNGAVYQDAPLKFEAGTPNISGIIGLAGALQYMNKLDRDLLFEYELELLRLCEHNIKNINGINLISNADSRIGIVAFTIEGCHSLDVSTLLDEQNIAIRSGQLCAIPLVRKFNSGGVLRVSFSFYNTTDEVLTFVKALKQSISLLRG